MLDFLASVHHISSAPELVYLSHHLSVVPRLIHYPQLGIAFNEVLAHERTHHAIVQERERTRHSYAQAAWLRERARLLSEVERLQRGNPRQSHSLLPSLPHRLTPSSRPRSRFRQTYMQLLFSFSVSTSTLKSLRHAVASASASSGQHQLSGELLQAWARHRRYGKGIDSLVTSSMFPIAITDDPV